MDALQLDTVRISDDKTCLEILDQTLLPNTIKVVKVSRIEDIWEAIRLLRVRGAPAIGVCAGYAIALAASQIDTDDPVRFCEEFLKQKAYLASARPTAVNLFWALERMERKAKECGGAAEPLIAEAKAIHAEDVAMCRAMGAHGAAVVPEHARILTHCNAGALATGGYGTALGVIRAAHEAGKVNMVYCDETRPLLQGARLTAYELVSDHIPATLIADNMAASLMAKGKIDLAVVGCDRMAANGDFANKIGTYSVAVNAHYHGIPFYVALPCSTIDLSLADGSGIPIEERDRDEVRTLYGTRTAPESVEVCNPAFDVTPHSLVTGIITEKGVIYPPFQENLQKLFG